MTILVAGSTGLVGSAVLRAYERAGIEALGINSKVLDLTDNRATVDFIQKVKPTLIIDAAAKVGGIGANNSMPVEFLTQNIQIQNNLMEAAHKANVARFVFLASSCVYPRDCPQPIKEEYLMTGPLEKTNSAYAIAKIAGVELIKSYRKEFNRQWISLMPTNVYGPNDNFDLDNSHVLPAFIRKFVEATDRNEPHVTVWGTGEARREFLHVDDLASAILLASDNYNEEQLLNIGTGVDVTIQELATQVQVASGFKGEIIWDKSKPNGTPRRVLDVSRITKLGWTPNISLQDGIRKQIEWFRKTEMKRLVEK